MSATPRKGMLPRSIVLVYKKNWVEQDPVVTKITQVFTTYYEVIERYDASLKCQEIYVGLARW